MQGTVAFSRRWQTVLADIFWIALASGPIAAPFLAASGWLFLPQIADIIYALGQRVCPQPDLGLPLVANHGMAVCMRCYGTVAGLIFMRWLYGRTRGAGSYWLEQYGIWGFTLCFILCLAYPLELAMQGFSWWGMNPVVMTLFGGIAGVGLGAYLMPAIYGSES